MKQPYDRKSVPLGDTKLERLAILLGEFLAQAWLKNITGNPKHSNINITKRRETKNSITNPE
jgi:hypothetical protein